MRRIMLVLLLLLFLLTSCVSENTLNETPSFEIDPVLDITDQGVYFVSFDGTPYCVGVLLHELYDGGFLLSLGGQLQGDTVLSPGQSLSGTLAYPKNGESLVDITVYNPTESEAKALDCRVVRFELREIFTQVEVSLANGITFGDTAEEVVTVFGLDFLEEAHAVGTALTYRVLPDGDLEVSYSFVFGKDGTLISFSMNDFR